VTGTDPLAGAAPGAVTAPRSSGVGALDSDAFLRLMVAQLKYQNPMQPSDPSAFMQQTAAFTQVETLQKIAATQQQLKGLDEVVLATTMVGQQVTADTDRGQVSGVVSGVTFTDQGALLQVGPDRIPVTQVRALGTTT
jgi:flagellar basal-body rod modification protein FlgD